MKSTSVNHCVTGWWVAHSAAAVQQVLNDSSVRSSAAAGPAAAAERLRRPALQGHLRTALEKCLVPVRLQTLGKGVPETGAAILNPMSQNVSSSHQPSHAKETQSKLIPLSSTQMAADKQVMDQQNDDRISCDDLMDISQAVDMNCDHDRSTAEPELETQSASKRAKLADNMLDEGELQPNILARAPDMTAGVDNESSAEAAAQAENVDISMAHVTSDDLHDAEEEQHQKRGHEAMSSAQRIDRQQIVIGVVTTEAPRGLSGATGPRAVCSLAALKHLYAQQLATRLIQSSNHGILVQCQNQNSTKPSRAALYCMYDTCWQRLFAH